MCDGGRMTDLSAVVVLVREIISGSKITVAQSMVR